ncbi:MAG TPA: TetR/AcrR family transcriptional regulator [Lachnospiraceae bacterium]|nr:TetR/AcrR family transcriptional regulator [Lachnospiraceae bacterium]
MKQTAKNVSPMSNEGRNTYVVEHITDTILTLLKEKPLTDISISELCDKAGVGRVSFYRNYESKEDIIRNKTEQIFHDWVSSCEIKDDIPLSQKLKDLFGHFEKNRDFYKLLSDRGLIYIFKDIFMDDYGAKPEDEMFMAYTKAYFASVLYGWIEVWFMRGMRDSAEDIAALFQSQGL